MSRKRQKQVKLQRPYVADGYANFVSRQGLRADNTLSHSTYLPTLISWDRIKLENAYRSSWLVGTAVDAIATDMTRSGISINSSDKPEDVTKILSRLTRLGVWSSLLKLIKWARLYGGAIGVIMIDGQDLGSPLNLDTVAKNSFSGLSVYDRWQVNPDLVRLVRSGPNMGMPEYYRITTPDITPTQQTDVEAGVLVHHSRVIRMVGIELPFFQAVQEQLWGESIIERMYDRLVAFDSATMGAANLIDKAYLRTIKVEKLREILSAGGKAQENLEAMFGCMAALQTSQGVTLLDKNDDFQPNSYSFAGIPETILQFGQQIAGATGIPLVRLFGQSPAGLSATGDSDIRNYYDNISALQESMLATGMLKILEVMHRSVLGTDAPEDFEFYFNPLWQMSAREKAEIAKYHAEMVVGLHSEGILDTPTALKELKQSSNVTGIFTNITDELITEAENEPPPAPVMPEIDPSQVLSNQAKENAV